jgi:alkanesulfonate monooxygenase SsuD/methylene tetrahydromethanopterin reductase-like flavin-dependent oxidoreductase (luciferase family)
VYTMRFDMRAPARGAPPVELYAAVPQMCAWAEDHGCIAAVLCEHHASDDGYLPAPLMLASAVAGRTQRLVLSLILILPFYDPVRLAEDMAVLDILSAGRASYILALGYRPEEFEQFGLSLRDRGRLADEKLTLLRRLLAGETVVHEGRRITVTPRPHTGGGPGLMWGGGTLAAARRAGRYGLGMLANADVPGMREAYEAACREHGHQPGPAFFPDRDHPSVVFVAEDVDQAWSELGEYLLHDVRAYAAWNPGDETTAGFSYVETVDELRDAPASHVIISVPEAISRVRAGKVLNLSPLCGGLPPEIAWPYLKRVGEVVLPEAARAADEAGSAESGGDTELKDDIGLDELFSNRKT